MSGHEDSMGAEVQSLVADLTRDLAIGEIDGLWPTVLDLGLSGIGVPEEAGGSGGSLADLATAVTEFAARGAHFPLAEAATARWALQGDLQRRDVAATVAVAQPGGEVHGGRVTAVARRVGGLREADAVVLVVAGRASPVVVDARTVGVLIHPATDLAGVPADELCLAEVPATDVGVDADLLGARLATLRAAAMVGAARGAYELTRAHLRARHQFGRPLVDIPVVGTSLASMRVEVLQARTALDAALAGVESGDPALAAATAATARIVAAGTAGLVAERAHQLHGAIGTTQEYALHRLTTLLWTLRDADVPQPHWAARLGEAAVESGEERVWDLLTAP